MSAPTAYPLAWPLGWPRTPSRANGLYKTSLAGALKNLRDQVRLLAGDKSSASLVLSSNCSLGSERPTDPGVVAYFLFDGSQVAIPCDRWMHVEQNVQAIALTIESMRAIERHGAKHMVKAMFQGFTALPAPDDWRGALGHPKTLAEAEANYRSKIQAAHPDKGGSEQAAAALNAAIAEARKALR
jgi:hypothetical protein